jgi:hypothetical protein
MYISVATNWCRENDKAYAILAGIHQFLDQENERMDLRDTDRKGC